MAKPQSKAAKKPDTKATKEKKAEAPKEEKQLNVVEDSKEVLLSRFFRLDCEKDAEELALVELKAKHKKEISDQEQIISDIQGQLNATKAEINGGPKQLQLGDKARSEIPPGTVTAGTEAAPNWVPGDKVAKS